MRGIFFFSFAILLCLQNVTARKALQVDYMDGPKSRIKLDICQSGYYSSGILKAHGSLSYSSGMNKTMNVSAPYGYSLLVSIRLIDLRPSKQDVLTIFDFDGLRFPLSFSNDYNIKNRRYYPKEDITFFAYYGQVGIRFTTGPSYLNYGYDGFELVYTVLGNGFHCYKDDFRCENGRCIAHVLKCDDHNHCGDQSSLKYCSHTIGPGRKIGIPIGIVFLVIALACGIFIAVRKTRRSTADTHTIITRAPPPTHLPSYPYANPQPGTYYPPPPPQYSQGIANPAYH